MALRRGGVWGVDGRHAHHLRDTSWSLKQRTTDSDNLDAVQSGPDVLQDEVRRIRRAGQGHGTARINPTYRLGAENVMSIPDETPAMRLKRLHEINSRELASSLRTTKVHQKSANSPGFPSLGHRHGSGIDDFTDPLESGTTRRPSYAEILANPRPQQGLGHNTVRHQHDLSDMVFDGGHALPADLVMSYEQPGFSDQVSESNNSVRCYAPDEASRM